MFLGYRIKRRTMPAYDKAIVPELNGYRSISDANALPVSNMKHNVRGIFRIAACMILVLTLFGVIMFQNAGGFKTKTTTVQNGMSAQGATAKDSFTLVAYAATPSATSSGGEAATTAAMDIDQSTSTELQPNIKINLPVGKLNTIRVGSSNSITSPQYSSGFQFEGSDIDTITMTTAEGILYGKDAQKIQRFVSQQPDDPAKWTDSDWSYLRTILKQGRTITITSKFTACVFWETEGSNNNFTDTISIDVKFKDGTTKSYSVTVNTDKDGNINATLSE